MKKTGEWKCRKGDFIRDNRRQSVGCTLIIQLGGKGGCIAQAKDNGTDIPQHKIESLSSCLLPKIQAFFESEEGEWEFEEWKKQTRQTKIG